MISKLIIVGVVFFILGIISLPITALHRSWPVKYFNICLICTIFSVLFTIAMVILKAKDIGMF